jgi:adenylate kinase
MNIILIGIQGSGKGTQAKLLNEKYGWEHITTGDLFRNNIEAATELGLKAKKFIDKGELVPDKYVFLIVKDALEKAVDGFVLDGFPRNIEQVRFLQENFDIQQVVLLELSDDKAVERLMARRNCVICKKDYNILFKKPQREGICDVCGGELIMRDDDTEKAIRKRIEKFHNETNRVIEYYTEQGLLVTVNADQPVEAIYNDIISKLGVE